jgi:excisionase family DNA binding protein
LTTGQAAKLCEVTPDTILKWIRKGRIQGTRTAGGHYRINLRDLQPHIPPGRLEGRSAEMPTCFLGNLHCWEYLSDKGVVREECKKCVVYRVRAARCFQMADLGAEVGHARQFCRSSCEECMYYRRAQGLPANVLVITPDETLRQRLSSEENDGLSLRVAHSAYEASAIIQNFQAAFVIVDEEALVAGEPGLLEHLSTDPRLPGVKIVLAVRQGRSGAPDDKTNEDVVFSVIEKPFGPRHIAAVINSLPVEKSIPAESSARA